jgi:hypothetical protein
MPSKTDQQVTGGRPLEYGLATWGVLRWGSLAFVLLGVWFRLWELGQQPVLGDEMHALKSAAAVTATLMSILAEKGFPDVSIPLALWHYLLLNTAGLSEWGMRLPMLASGVLFLLLLHRFLHQRLGEGSAFIATGLASLSPLLIMFSRFARPYMPLVLLSLLALHCWLRHLEGKSFAWVGAILVTTMAAALTPICLPALGSLAVTAAALRYNQNRRASKSQSPAEALKRARWSHLAILAVFVVIFAFALGQTWHLGSHALDLAKAVDERGLEINWPNVGMHLVGTTHRWVVFTMTGLTIIGASLTWLRARSFALVLTVMMMAQVLTIITMVQWGDRTFSIVRYCMVLIPGLLAWAAVGLDGIARLIRGQLMRRVSQNYVRLGFTGITLLLLTSQGPLPGIFRAHNSFTNFWPTTVRPPHSNGSEKGPAWPRFYNALVEFPGELTILEAPTVSMSRGSVMPYASYQLAHGRRVLLMNGRGPFRHENMEMQSTIVPERRDKMHLGDASILVLHKDLEGERKYMHELRTVRQRDGAQREGKRNRAGSAPITMAADSHLQARAKAILEFCLQDETLKTIYEDNWVRVFSRDPEVLAAGEAWKIGFYPNQEMPSSR